MSEDAPKNEKEAVLRLMAGLSAEEERQILLASAEADMVHTEPGKEREVHEQFLKGLERISKFKDHNTGFFMMVWIGADPKGEVQGLYELAGNAPTMMICAHSMPKIINENLREANQCPCPACLLSAKIRAATYMQQSVNKERVRRRTDA